MKRQLKLIFVAVLLGTMAFSCEQTDMDDLEIRDSTSENKETHSGGGAGGGGVDPDED